ncbi:hypothetical protein [Neopusillimonas aromaticivorans]|uniref:hypothetical protein n=1 Tax=Neopusillimonas aromaticivorans TaxID=2979868 RepID=UPI0025944009|nr:hypothetical protein [Neopusillimonas aromaticivorans]WJJ93615.1 hypothetical protein N7E01_17285 [Neopusillimonas aromaticivorans]
MKTAASQYPWIEELERTVVHSLATSFGLDFLLFKDKVGGEVDTIHNVRQGVWATDKERQNYENRETYDSDKYHHKDVKKEDSTYKTTGANDKLTQQTGTLQDPYRNRSMAVNDPRNTDHVISASEVHDDAGRVLAEINGIELANQSSNLQSTHETLNKSKGKDSIDVFLARLPEQIAKDETQLLKDRDHLATMPRTTPEQQHKGRQLEDKVRKTEEKIKTLKSVDPDEMRKRDKEARKPYNQQINQKYYTSSKFWKQTTSASAVAGLKMGTRQMLGLIMAEAWFELREQLPKTLEKLKTNFNLDAFIASVQQALNGIWQRIKLRFKDFLNSFKDGVFAGILSSATTTLFNVFATTQKMAIKIIRELWGSLVKAVKLLIFNPQQQPFVDLCKAVTALLSVGAATVVGTMIYTQLLPLCNFPFGSELASFASALATGLITLGLNYFLLYSSLAEKLWAFVDSIMPHAASVRKFQAINAELDRYLTELGRIEFNLDADELAEFAQQLASCNDELQRGLLLKDEISNRGVELPFEMGDRASTRKWLTSLVK